MPGRFGGTAAVMIVCEWLHLQSVTRSAVVAILIITMHEPGPDFWKIVLERAADVVPDGLTGVALTFVFHLLIMLYSE